jgi:hypothetical protein
VKAFYPSSVFIDEPSAALAEYAVAKAAGEALCAVIEKTKKGISISRPRLSKMATDQTVSLTDNDRLDPAPIMLKELRAFGRNVY